MIKIDQKIPELELEAFHEQEIKKIKLHENNKWLVLVFYPADFTFVCPTELEELADLYNEFRELDAEVMSVSTDTVFTHKAWHDKSEAIKKIKFPMLADPTGKLCKELGTYIEEEGLSLRGSFIFNDKGELKSFEMNNNDIGRNAKELLRKVKAAKFVSENEGQVCPASWEPGKDTLKPGLDLVGKI
ncbi:peroxiredoxin [archaeon]|nr:peroxiredoxin [archaeon]|tara:strand:- start:18620 stop:19180 length:561 start_codon:yes stop_codon:yes gene_type:complete